MPRMKEETNKPRVELLHVMYHLFGFSAVLSVAIVIFIDMVGGVVGLSIYLVAVLLLVLVWSFLIDRIFPKTQC